MSNLNNGAQAPALPACLNKGAADLSTARVCLTERQKRALLVLLDPSAHATVKRLVAAANVNNAPELVASLRRLGLKIPCTNVAFTTAEGRSSRYGRYELTECDKRKALEWLQHEQP